MPKISVIVPVYKVEPYIYRCIESILNQTFTDFDLILIDDGSPDNCGKICDEYAKKDDRIHVIHQKNGGLSAARNAGIDWAMTNCDSEWLTFVDSDDWLHPRALDILLATALKYQSDISICELKKTSNNFEIENIISERSFLITTEEVYVRFHTSATVACAKLYKKQCFNNIRYPKGKIHEDEFITYRILFTYPRIAYVESQLYYYYQHQNSIMNAVWSPNRLSIFEAYDEQLAFFRENGYTNAYLRQLKSYFWLLADYISLIERTNNKKLTKNKKILKKKLHLFIYKYKKISGITINSDPFIFEKAYPNFMRLYWVLKSIYRKLKFKE